MKTHTDNSESAGPATLDQPGITSVTVVNEPQNKPKRQINLFHPRPSLLLDILPAEEFDAAMKKPSSANDEKRNAQKDAGSSDEMLQQLLLNAETTAHRTQASRMKWQLSTLTLLMLLAPMLFVAIRLYHESRALWSLYGRIQNDNHSLQKQLNIAGIQLTGLKGELDTLLNRNLELAGQAAKLREQKQASQPQLSVIATDVQKPAIISNTKSPPIVNKAPSFPAAAFAHPPDTKRIELIKKGSFPNGATKDELITALGQPDRIYKSRNYDQFVYFDQKPRRFWFIGNWLVQTSN